MTLTYHNGARWGGVAHHLGERRRRRKRQARLPLNPRLPSQRRENVSIHSQPSVSMSRISCCATVFSNRQLRTCFDGRGGKPAAPHVDLSAWWAPVCSSRSAVSCALCCNENQPRSVCCSLTERITLRAWVCVIKPIAKATIIIAKHSVHMLASRKPLERMNIPQRKRRLFRMSSVTHSHWAICNSHFCFEGSWALNREEFPFEGRIRWNRPGIISILMAPVRLERCLAR